MLEELLIKIRGVLEGGGFDETISYINAVENTSQAATNQMQNDINNVDSTSSSVWSRITNTASSAWDSIKSSASSAIDGILGGLESLTAKMSSTLTGMSGMIATGLGAVGVKSLGDLTIANAKAADTNRTLMKTMTATAEQSKSLWDASDNATNNSLMSMRELVPTMSAFQAQTQANSSQMELYAETAAKLGSKSMALGYSSEITTTALMGMGNALEGSYAVLQKYGITEQTLLDTGVWTGKKDDLEGFLQAVQIATGDIGDLMTTIEGKEKSVFKKLSVAGRQWGEELTPIIESVYDGFLGLNKETDGWVAKITVGAAGAISTFATIAPTLESSFNIFGKISQKIGDLRKGAEFVEKAGKIGDTVGKISKYSAQTAELGANTTALTANTTALKANNMARTISSKGAGAATVVSGKFTEISSLGANAGNAAPGVAAGATGLSSIGASISAMIVPLLVISAVIAIMIPIIAGIVAEIIIFVRLLGELIKLLAFDKLNLKGAIEGIKQIGLAMWEIGRVFTVMLGINLMNIVYTVTGGLLNTVIALNNFKEVAKQIAKILPEIPTIDSSKVKTIEDLANIIKAISKATTAIKDVLGWFNWNMVNAADTYNFNLNTKYLVEIAKEIDAQDIPNVSDKSASIQALADIIKNIQTATENVKKTIGWFNADMINYDNKENFLKNLDKLKEIAEDINNYTMPDISAKKETYGALGSIMPNIQKATQAVKDTIGWFDTNVITWDNVSKFTENLDKLKQIADKINNIDFANLNSKTGIFESFKAVIKSIVDITKNIKENIDSLAGTVINTGILGTAIDNLYIINQNINSKAFGLDSSKTEAITNMKTFIQRLAEIGLYLNNNTGNISSIAENKESVSNAIQALYELNQKINSMPFEVDTAKADIIASLKTLIQSIVDTLNTNANVQSAAKNLGSKLVEGFKSSAITLKNVASAEVGWAINTVNTQASSMWTAGSKLGSSLVRGFKSGLNAHSPGDAAKAMAMEMEFIKNAVTDNYSNLYDMGKTAINQVASGFGHGVNSGSPGDYANAVLDEMNYALDFMSNAIPEAYSLAQSLGESIVAGFGNPVLPAVGNEGFEDFNYNSLNGNLTNGGNTVINNDVSITIKDPIIREEEDLDNLEYRLEALLDRKLRLV